MLRLDPLWAQDPQSALALVDSFGVSKSDAVLLAMSVELALATAASARLRDKAAGFCLLSADRAYRYRRLVHTLPDEGSHGIRYTRTREIYDRVVAGFIEARYGIGSVHDCGNASDSSRTLELSTTHRAARVVPSRPGRFPE